MVRNSVALKDPEALAFETAPFNAVEMQKRSVRAQTGQNCRARIEVGPLQHLDQTLPVRFVLKMRRPWLGARNDETIEMAIPQGLDARVRSFKVLPALLASFNGISCSHSS